MLEKIEMLHKVVVQLEKQCDVAKKYRISQQVISKLVSKVRKAPKVLAEIYDKQSCLNE